MQNSLTEDSNLNSEVDSNLNSRKANKTRTVVIHAFVRETYEIFLFLSILSLLYFILSGYNGSNAIIIANSLRLIFTIACYLISHRMREGKLPLFLLWLVILMNICIIPIFSVGNFYFRILDILSFFFMFWFTGFHPMFLFFNSVIGICSLTWSNYKLLATLDNYYHEERILHVLSFTLLFSRLSVGLVVLLNIYTNCSIIRDITINKISSLYDIDVIIENERELISHSKSLGISLKKLINQTDNLEGNIVNSKNVTRTGSEVLLSSTSILNSSSVNSVNDSRALSYVDNSIESSSLGSSIFIDTPIQSVGEFETLPYSSSLQGLYNSLLVKRNELYNRFSPSMTFINKYKQKTKQMFRILIYKYEHFVLTIRFSEFQNSTLPISTKTISQEFLDQEFEGMYIQWLRYYSCITVEKLLLYIFLSCIITPFMSSAEWIMLFLTNEQKLLCNYSPYVCAIKLLNKTTFLIIREGIQLFVSILIMVIIYFLCEFNKIKMRRESTYNSQKKFEKDECTYRKKAINCLYNKMMNIHSISNSIHTYIQLLTISIGTWVIFCNIVDCLLMGNITLRFVTLSSTFLIAGTYLNLRVTSTIIIYSIWGLFSFIFTVVISGGVDKYIPCLLAIIVPSTSVIFLHTIPLDRVRRILFCRYVLPYILYIQHTSFVLKDSGEDIKRRISTRFSVSVPETINSNVD
ncbi:hypothetical protein FG386_000307 [Cryptosporidium ryanae]|uniref:uncharacterized protein n=1 Tax=Cryptosporidium ryanae TaxID=515981 RepID=UPI003519E954|nr:hypothetical protein FG386_000307 [Cryptosporidium ryanae]